jgi:hypothetical protein
MYSVIAHASARPSNVLVPRPISSRMTSDAGVALFKMRAVSTISTMKVDWPRAISSAAPTRAKMRSAGANRIARAGTHEPVWASSTSSAVWRM